MLTDSLLLNAYFAYFSGTNLKSNVASVDFVLLIGLPCKQFIWSMKQNSPGIIVKGILFISHLIPHYF